MAKTVAITKNTCRTEGLGVISIHLTRSSAARGHSGRPRGDVLGPRSVREVVIHRDVDGELLAAQDWRHRHVGSGAPEHLLRLPIEHLVARGLGDRERRELAAWPDDHAQRYDAFPVVVGRRARIALVLRGDHLELEAIALQRTRIDR